MQNKLYLHIKIIKHQLPLIFIIFRLFLDHFHYGPVNLVTAEVEGVVGIDIVADPQDAFTVVVHYFYGYIIFLICFSNTEFHNIQKQFFHDQMDEEGLFKIKFPFVAQSFQILGHFSILPSSMG